MLKVAVLGAGYMGSAVTFPLAHNGIATSLWGTWLDDELIDGALAGCHPKLRKPLPDGVKLFRTGELKEAVRGADAVFIAVTSDGFEPVFRKLLDATDGKPCLLAMTKGFVQHGGMVQPISTVAEELFRKRFRGAPFLWASVGGPVKAVELAEGIPTATIFGVKSPRLKPLVVNFATGYYRIFFTDDVRGVELCSALKNVYAIATGISDGMYEGCGAYYHNFKALLFNQSLREIAAVVQAAGGREDTVFDLPGAGDLYVTSASGRNGMFGRRIGRGEVPSRAYGAMLREGDIAEGYHALRLGKTFIEQLGGDLLEKLHLFNTLYSIIFQGNDCRREMEQFVLRYGSGD